MGYGLDAHIQQLDDIFFPTNSSSDSKGLKTVNISGIDSAGPSTFALFYPVLSRSKFDIILVPLDQRREKAAASREMVKEWLVNPLVEDDSNEETPREKETATWLLILEGVENPDCLADFWPHRGTGCIIVTSDTDFSQHPVLNPALSIVMPPLDVECSKGYLLAFLGGDLTPDKRPDYRGIDVDDALTGIAKVVGGGRDDLESIADFILEAKVPVTTDAAIWQKHISRPAFALLQILSLVSNGHRHQTYETLLNHPSWSKHLPDYPQSMDSFVHARDELVKNKLVEPHEASQQYGLFLETWPPASFDNRSTADRLKECNKLFPFLDRVRVFFEKDIRSGRLVSSREMLALMADGARHNIETGHFDDIEPYVSLCHAVFSNLKIAKEELDQGETLHRLFSRILQYDACARIFTDRPGALEKLEEVIALIEYRLKRGNRTEDALQLADVYNDIGMALTRDKTQEEAAIASFLKSYEAFGKIPSDPLNVKIRQEGPVINLSLIYTLRGELEKAEETLLLSIKARQEKFGTGIEKPMIPGKALHALANIHRKKGNVDASIRLYERAGESFSQSIGSRNDITADTDYYLAVQWGKSSDLGARHRPGGHLMSITSYFWKGTDKTSAWVKPQAARAEFAFG
ncbi:hypothetical protein QBC44DRAFT_388326 [Cladorrhinum sp. PSN332]|nr:hypothetical protein QBC44DRAFT_388326 [Cladorrhinum sp. PSN332]